MINALLITVIGMGLVFIVILLLWAMMELLVRVMADKQKPVGIETNGVLPERQVEPVPDAALNKRKVAAVAVAAAIQIRRRQAAEEAVRKALSYRESKLTAPIKTIQTSSWQAVMRAIQRQNQQKLFSRTPGMYGKSRGETK